MTKSSDRESESVPSRRSTVVLQFTLAGAIVGFVVGLVEATLLYMIPRVPILLQPDVRYVIWFLAPFVGFLSFGLLGTGLGVAAALGKRSHPKRNATLVAVVLGVAGAYVATVVGTLHEASVGTLAVLSRATPWISFAVVFGSILLALRLGGRRAGVFFDAQTRWSLILLAKVVVVALGIMLSGLVYFLVRRPPHQAPGQTSSLPSGGRPNVVLITLDAVRADHLSAYGYSRLTTPNLDRLAAQGVLFENAVAASSWTIPSHISMFTGLLPHQHGANFYTPIDTSPWALAEVLQARGYETAGFTSNLGVGYAGWGMGQGFEVYEDDSSSLRHNLAATLVGRTFVQPLYRRLRHYDRFDRRDASEVNRDVSRWFRSRSARPFFLFINYFDAHDPYWAPPPFDTRFGQVSNALVQQLSATDGHRSPKSLSAQDRESLVAGYDNCVSFLDDQVGKLMAILAASPEWSNTVVIITSDHGKAFGEHGHFNHGQDLYREMLHVPLIILGPGVPAGQRVSHTAQIRDIFSTALDFAWGEKFPLRATSLRRLWTPGWKARPFDEAAVSELSLRNPDSSRRAFVSLMTDEWHYLHSSEGLSELYHWPTDPEERSNVVDSPDNQRVLGLLRERLYQDIGLSIRPWRGPDYLLALSRPGHSFLDDLALDAALASNPLPGELPVGSAQALFAPAVSPPLRPSPADSDLIKSLPYH